MTRIDNIPISDEDYEKLLEKYSPEDIQDFYNHYGIDALKEMIPKKK